MVDDEVVLGGDFEQWRKGDKTHPPTCPTEWDELIINFFLTIYKIIAKENHVLKYKGKGQVVEIINLAAQVEDINLVFFESEGEWGLMDTGYTLDDLMNLQRISYRFSRIYRFHAKDYGKEEKEDLKELLEDFK